jgi:hypothetical protein
MAIESWVVVIKLLSHKSANPSYYRWRNIGKPAGQFHIRRALMGPTQERLVPLASLRSARVLTGLYSAFSNPVQERLADGMANMRLARRGPIGTTVSLLR